MHVFRDTASIRGAVTQLSDPELCRLIGRRMDELAEYGDDLGDLLNIYVVEPGDALADVDAQLGFALMERPIDVIECHRHWCDLTIVLSDDGFGVVVYVPIHRDTDAALLSLCGPAAGESPP